MCDQTVRQYHSDRPNSSMEEFELIGAYSSDPIIISPSLLKLVDQCNKYVNDDNYVPLESFTLTKKTKKLINGDQENEVHYEWSEVHCFCSKEMSRM